MSRNREPYRYVEIDRLCSVTGTRMVLVEGWVEGESATREGCLTIKWIDLGKQSTSVEYRFLDYEYEVIVKMSGVLIALGKRYDALPPAQDYLEADEVLRVILASGFEFSGVIPKLEPSDERTDECLRAHLCDSCGEATTSGLCWEDGCLCSPCQGQAGQCCAHGWLYGQDLRDRLKRVIGRDRLDAALAKKRELEDIVRHTMLKDPGAPP